MGNRAYGDETARFKYFVRIAKIEELTSNGVYLIGAVCQQNDEFYLMSQKPLGKWLTAQCQGSATEVGSNITCDNDSCFWQVEVDDDGQLRLLSFTDQKYLCNDKDTNLKTSAKQSTTWSVECADGLFSFFNADEERYITASYEGGDDAKFAAYKGSSPDTQVLYIYKGVAESTSEEGCATLMTDGDDVALCTTKYIATKDMASISGGGLFLHNGTIANDEGFATWRYVQLADSSFVLADSEGLFLNNNLELADTETLWRISNGRIVTAETPSRILCWNGDFVLRLPEAISSEMPVRFCRVVKPDSLLSTDGEKSLSGGWSAQRLETLDWTNVRQLNLVNISLPTEGLGTLQSRPADANIPIMVNESEQDFVPQEWNFVVSCTASSSKLLTPTLLIDKAPLYLTSNIVFASGQLSYRRSLHDDDGWESLILPFEAQLPQGLVAYAFSEVADSGLVFKPQTCIPAYTPLLFRRDESSSSSVATELTLTASSDGVLAPISDDNSTAFRGTFEGNNVTSASERKYFMNALGQAFALADAGSTLRPFRAYFQTSQQLKTLKIKTVPHQRASSPP